MIPALQAILFAPDPLERLKITLGEKKMTILEGHRDYHEGPVVLFSHIFPWAVMATITSVRHTTLSEVTEEEIKAYGCAGRTDLLRDLRKHYPCLTTKSSVTVISWGDVVEDCG